MNLGFLTRLRPLFSRLATWTLVLFRKKIFLVLATYWTFSNTLKAVLDLANGVIGLGELWSIFVSESYSKFLGAAPKVLQGLNALNNGDVIQSITFLWTGVAAVIMLLYIWRFFRERFLNYSVDVWEYALVLMVWLLLTSQVHGQTMVVGLLNQAYELLNGLSDLLPSQELNETVNSSINSSSG